MREFAFELDLCARLEGDGIVARQLGGGVGNAGRRVVDVVRVEPGPEFDARTALTSSTIPDLALQAAVAVGRAVPRQAAFADLDVPPERQREVVERAAEIGFFERDRRDGRTVVRQVAPYPDWFDGLTAIENKPDLATPGALAAQLRFDIALSAFDRVVVATESYVTGAHEKRIPDPVGIWRVQSDGIEVVREPESLDVDGGGTEVRAETPARTDVEFVSPHEIEIARRRIAERAYGKGFRTYEFPPCARVDAAERSGSCGLPYCREYDRLVDPARDCGPACPGFVQGAPPDVDLESERDAASPWESDPPGRARSQSQFGHFVD